MSVFDALDTLGMTKRLEQAGFTREMAEIQAEFWREQHEALRKALDQRETLTATRGDVRLEVEKVRGEIKETGLRLRKEIENVRGEIKETELRLRKEIENVRLEVAQLRGEVKTDIEQLRGEVKTDIEQLRGEVKTDIEQLRGEIEKGKHTLLKWQIAIGLALGAIMARGFGWLGF